ncbi:MAG: flagellin N-terminal helical domain-containing protein [bacterium]
MIQVTDNMIYNNINNELSNESTNIYNLQSQISSGLQINYPQDNPAGMVNVLSYKNSTALITQYNSNVSLASEVGSLASSTISNTIGVVNQAQSLAVEMANGTNTSMNNTAAAQQVGQIINELTQAANTSYNGQNIFTGNNLNLASAYTTTTAYYKAANSNGTTTPVSYSVYTYAGTDTSQNYQITQNESVAPSLTADSIFGNDKANPSGNPASSSTSYTPSGLISTLSLFKSELSAGVYRQNSSGIISGLNNGLNQMLSAQSTLGTVVQRLNEQQTSYQTVLSNISQLLGQTQDVNVATAMTSLTQAQNSYQATLEASSNITSLTPMLLQYLK